MKTQDFKGPFQNSLNGASFTKFIYDATGELVAKVVAPDDSHSGMMFAIHHADLFSRSFELLSIVERLMDVHSQNNAGPARDELLGAIALEARRLFRAEQV